MSRKTAETRLQVIAMLTLLAILCSLPNSASAQERDQNDVVHPSLLENMEYRQVGPFRGGRSTAVGGFPDDPHAYIMGTTGGGVWITEDAGETWENVTDGFLDVSSIGAVEVARHVP